MAITVCQYLAAYGGTPYATFRAGAVLSRSGGHRRSLPSFCIANRVSTNSSRSTMPMDTTASEDLDISVHHFAHEHAEEGSVSDQLIFDNATALVTCLRDDTVWHPPRPIDFSVFCERCYSIFSRRRSDDPCCSSYREGRSVRHRAIACTRTRLRTQARMHPRKRVGRAGAAGRGRRGVGTSGRVRPRTSSWLACSRCPRSSGALSHDRHSSPARGSDNTWRPRTGSTTRQTQNVQRAVHLANLKAAPFR